MPGTARTARPRAPRWAGTASPRRSAPAAPRSAGCCMYVLRGRPGRRTDRRGRVRLPLQDDQAARPQRRLRDQHVVRLLRRRQDRARPLRHPEPRRDLLRRDAAGHQGRRGRRREPHLLERQRDRLQGHHPRRLQQRPGQRHPGRVDDHPAVHQDPLPHPGALLHAQAQGGDPLPQAGPRRSPSRRSSRATSTPSTSGAAPTASRPRREAYFDKAAAELSLKESAALASIINNPNHFDPANGKESKIALRERYAYVLDGMAQDDKISADEAEQAAKRLPKFPPEKAESTYGGQKGHVLTMVKSELLKLKDETATRCSPRTRSTAAGCGSPRPSPRRRWTPPRRASWRSAPEGGFSDKELHIGVASVDVAHRRGHAASTPGRTTSSRRSTGRWPAVMAGSSIKPFALAAGHQGGLLAQGHLRRQLAVRAATTAPRSRTRATTSYGVGGEPDQGARGLDQHRVHRPHRRPSPTGPRRSWR